MFEKYAEYIERFFWLLSISCTAVAIRLGAYGFVGPCLVAAFLFGENLAANRAMKRMILLLEDGQRDANRHAEAARQAALARKMGMRR